MKMFFLSVVCAVLAGCQSAPAPASKVVLREVKVPVPVECKEPMPARPVMPTESLQKGVPLPVFVKAAQAEIGRREGYEGQLRVALDNCKKPIGKGADPPD